MSVTKSRDEGIKVKGMYRVQLEEDGEVVGDSGWHDNLIVNAGFLFYIASALGAIAGSLQVGFFALGTGSAPASTDTTLLGEIQKRQAVTAATSSTSKGVIFTGAFSSANSFCTTTQNISNIGLFNSSSIGTLFAGNTYASSACASNQNVNVTYGISFV